MGHAGDHPPAGRTAATPATGRWAPLRGGSGRAWVLVGLGAMSAMSGLSAAAGPPPLHASLAAYPAAVVSVRSSPSGTVFYVEGDGQTVVAIQPDGQIAWRRNLLATLASGLKPTPLVIRHLRLETGLLWLTVGKSLSGKVDPETGQVTWLGAD